MSRLHTAAACGSPQAARCVRSIAALIFALTLCLPSYAAPYSGGQCNDVLPFELTDAATPTELLTAEGTVATVLDGQGVWTTEECARAMRKTVCMIAYFQLADNTNSTSLYCGGTCTSDLAPCNKYFDIAKEADEFWGFMCSQLPPNDAFGPLCVDGNEPAHYDEDMPICPKPLATFRDEDLDYEYGYVLKIDGSQCAVPCPSIVFDLDDLDDAWQYTYVLNFISTIMASMTTLIYAMDKKWLIVHFAAGNAVNSFTQLVTMTLDYDQDWLCRGENKVVYNRHHPWCKFQGFIATFAVVWIATWASIMAFQLYISVFTMQKHLMEKYFKYYMLAGWLIPSIFMIPIAARNEFGYDEELVIPICLVLQREDDTTFWVAMFLPWMLGVLVCLVLMGTASYQLFSMAGACSMPTWDCIRTGATGADDDGDSGNFKLAAWKRGLWFNRRTMVFIVVFGVFSLLTAFCALYSLYFNRSLFRNAVTDLVKCLLTEATDDPNEAKRTCGKTSDPAPPFWMAAQMDIFWSAYGCVPFIVYGTAGKLQALCGWSTYKRSITSYFGRLSSTANRDSVASSRTERVGSFRVMRRLIPSSASAPAVSTNESSALELVTPDNDA